MLSRLCLFLLILGALGGPSLAQKKGTAKPPPAKKTTQAKPKPVPVEQQVLEKMKALQKKALDDIAAERKYIFENIAPQFPPTHGVQSFREPGYDELEAQKRYARLDADFKKWQTGKMSSRDFLRAAYDGTRYSMDFAWRQHKAEAKLTAEALTKWLNDEISAREPRHAAAYSRELESYGSNPSPAARNAAYERWKAAENADRQELWNIAVERATEARERLSAGRRKWCVNFWALYDFAKAKSASPNDQHAWAAGGLGSPTGYGSIHETFDCDKAPNFHPGDVTRNSVGLGGLGPVMVGTGRIALAADPFGGSTELQPFVKARTNPELQWHPEYLGVLFLSEALEPPTDELRGAPEQEDPWVIKDTIVLPQVAPSGIWAAGRIKPYVHEGSAAYNLFIYGPKLPTKRSQLRRLGGTGKGIYYETLGVVEDLKGAPNGGELQRLRDAAVAILSRGRESELEDFKAMPFVMVRVRLSPGVVPGRKTFKINGVEAGWSLDQGTGRAEVRFTREVWDPEIEHPPGEKPAFEPTHVAYLGEPVRVEIQTVVPIDLKQIEIVVGKRALFMPVDGKPTVTAKQSPDDPRIYRTDPIFLLPSTDPRLDPEAGKDLREPGVSYFAVEAGDDLQAGLEDQRLFAQCPPTSLTVQPDPPVNPWYDALSRAAKCAGLHRQVMNWSTLPGKTAVEVSTTHITQVFFKARLQWLPTWAGYFFLLEKIYGVNLAKGDVTIRNRITLGDHAAMLLLKDHFITMMRDVVDELNTLDTDDKKIKFLDALGPHMGQLPLGEIMVYGNRPDSAGPPIAHPLKTFFDGGQDANEKASPGYIRAGKLHGFSDYKKAVDEALKKAEAIQDKEIDSLMALIGNGMSEVAADLVPRLMKSVRDSKSGGWKWVPDQTARKSLNGLTAAIEAVRAQREYKAIDTQVVLAAASLIPIFTPAGLLKTALSLALNLAALAEVVENSLPQYLAKEAEFRFALGASSVLGAERFYMADIQRTPAWLLAIELVGTGAAGFSAAGESLMIMSTITKRAALPLAKALAVQIRKVGAAAFAKAKPDEQAAFLACAAEAQLGEAAKGKAALSETEKELQGALKVVADEAKVRHKTIRLPDFDRPDRFVRPVEDDTLAAIIPSGAAEVTFTNGKKFQLGKLLSRDTVFFNVFRRATAEAGELWDQVIKISKETGEAAKATMEGVKKAFDTCVKKGIRHMELLDAHLSDEGSYIVQRFLKTDFAAGKEKFIVSDWLKRTVKMPDGTAKPYSFTPEMEDAILDLVSDMRNKGVCFEDFKFDNIYIERIGGENGKLVAGVIDVDRIAEWGDFSWYMNAITTDIEAMPKKFGIYSARGNSAISYDKVMAGVEAGAMDQATMDRILGGRSIRNADEYWGLILERRQMIYWDGTKFISGHLPVEKVLKAFPSLRNRGMLNFRNTPRVRPTRPAPPLALKLGFSWM